jgi:hypothetical protein
MKKLASLKSEQMDALTAVVSGIDEKEHEEDSEQEKRKKAFRKSVGVKLKVFMATLQVIVSVPGTFNITFPGFASVLLINMNVLNMLNAKYFIVKGNEGQAVSQQNPDALGNAWAVENIQWVKDADEEINALTDFNPDSLAVIDERFKSYFSSGNNTFTGAANVALTSYHPDKMKYSFDSESEQMVVFSEVFYNGNKDWISYEDGKEVEHIRVNYLLRGLKVPAGKHEIVFEFKPVAYYTGEKISLAANLLFIFLVGGYFFRRYKSKTAVA